MVIRERELRAPLREEPSPFSFLSKHPMFSVLPEAVLRDMSADLIRRTYRKGQCLFYAGDPQTFAFVVTTGLVALSDCDEQGNVHVALTYGKGDVFAAPSILVDVPHAFTAMAVADTSALLIRRATFAQCCREFPDLVHEIVRELLDLLQRSQKTTIRLAHLPVTGRLAHFLVRFAERVGDEQTLEFDLPLSRGDLAFLLNARSETINRTLAQLSRQRLVAIRGRRVVILQPEALRHLADG